MNQDDDDDEAGRDLRFAHGRWLGYVLLVALFFYAVVFVSWAMAREIEGDLGGQVQAYRLNMFARMLSGEGAQITGTCASACLTNLRDACIAQNGMLGLHVPFGGTPEQNERARQFLASDMPENLRQVFLAIPTTETQPLWLGYAAAVELGVKPCKGE